MGGAWGVPGVRARKVAHFVRLDALSTDHRSLAPQNMVPSPRGAHTCQKVTCPISTKPAPEWARAPRFRGCRAGANPGGVGRGGGKRKFWAAGLTTLAALTFLDLGVGWCARRNQRPTTPYPRHVSPSPTPPTFWGVALDPKPSIPRPGCVAWPAGELPASHPSSSGWWAVAGQYSWRSGRKATPRTL